MRTKHRKIFYLNAFLLISLLVALVCRADDRALDRASLHGVKTVVVRVHTFERDWAAELEKNGLAESVLQAAIERQLEKSAIAVIPEEASKRTETEGILNVRLRLLDPEPAQKTFLTATEEEIKRVDPKKKYVYAIRLNFRQQASLRRNPDKTIFAITWQTESVGFRRLAMMREDLENVVNVFIEAYLSENPGAK